MVEILTAELDKTGVLPFARFMELALYCPEHGFYEREKDSVGRRGDFYTSVSVGPLFGQMLAFQFAEWLRQFQIPNSKFQMVEAGAHDGKLAGDILTWLQVQRPGLFGQIEYWIVEPSPRRQAWQQETLKQFASQVRWFADLSAIKSAGTEVNGIIFSNELLDAFPVHRLGWDAAGKTWFEWGVAVEGGRFVWARMPPSKVPSSKFQVPSLPGDLLEVLPDGFTTEICPGAETWWCAAAEILRHGKLLTLDYGLAAEDFFHPERSRGTLRAYHCHRVSDDLLANVGEQDLTAHVNFTALQSAGEAAGLETEAFVTQAKFLTEIAGKIWQAPAGFGGWTAAQTRQFQTLTHPEHLGRAFRALVQTR